MNPTEQTTSSSPKPQNKPKRNFFSDVKNLRRNMKIVRNNPYAGLKFKYLMQKYMIILLSLLLIYRFYVIIIGYQAGSSIMILIGRILFLLILIFIIYKLFGTLEPLKRAIENYEKHPEHIEYKELNVKQEIDDILKHFDDKGKRINTDTQKSDYKGGYE